MCYSLCSRSWAGWHPGLISTCDACGLTQPNWLTPSAATLNMAAESRAGKDSV